MRQIGTIADETEARRLADYLLTRDITSRIDPTPDGWAIWIHREEKVPEARDEFEAFVRGPSDSKFQDATTKARAIRKQAERVEREHRRNTRDVREAWAGPGARRCPLTYSLIAISIAFTLISNFGRAGRVVDPLLFASYDAEPIVTADVENGTIVGNAVIHSDPLRDLARGEIWRPITPIFLHGGGIHLAFNMYWVYLLGSAIELRRKTRTLAAIVVVGAVISNLGQYLYSGHPFFYGMSGVVLTLFGYVWMKGLYEPESGLGLSRGTVTFMMIYLAYTTLFGMPGIAIANAAHLVGLTVGVLIGLGPHLFGGTRHE